MKGNEILVLAKLIFNNNKEISFEKLGKTLFLSASQIYYAANSLAEKGLIRKQQAKKTTKFQILKNNCYDFFVCGMRYIFPLKKEAKYFGVETLTTDLFKEGEKITGKETYVWPYAEGNSYGIGIVPIHKNIPKISLNDIQVYRFFIILDFLRSNNPRDILIGKKQLQLIFEKIK